MKNLLLPLLASSLLLTACVTEKQRLRICESCTLKSEAVHTVTESIRDTTIYVDVPGPVQFFENPCAHICDSLGNLKQFSVTKEENGISTTIKSQGNSIVISSEADSLKVQAKIKDTTVHDKETVTQEAKCKRDHRTKFDGFTFWGFWVLVAHLAVRLGWKRLRAYLPFKK